MFYGSQEGVFRIFPARHWDNCTGFDPRTRPWYVAASSGPKNVVLILDTSESMKGLKLKYLKVAAKRVIDTLTVLDRVAVVAFNDTSHVFADRTDGAWVMMDATEVNKAFLKESINALVPSGETNFYGAFNDTFETMKRTFAKESHDICNSAILFFTDGVMNKPEGINKTTVINLVEENLKELSSPKPVLFFTFSISTSTTNVHEFPRELACLSKFGVWSKIDSADQIVDSLNSYYRLFALGIGKKGNSDFVTWAEPYDFITGGVKGTTVAAPVYYRWMEGPPLFLGVVGMNLPLIAINKVLGVEDGTQAIIGILKEDSTASCPNLTLSQCEIEWYRGAGANCSSNCSASEGISTETTLCPNINADAYPKSLWYNIDLMDLSYEV